MFNSNTTFKEIMDTLKGKMEACRQEIQGLELEMEECTNPEVIKDYQRWINEQEQEIIRLKKLIYGLKLAAIETI